MSLRVWLPLNGTLDNLGTDEVTLTNHGATVNDNGKIGKCYAFDGTSLIQTNYLSDIGTGDFTICAWIYLTQTSGKTYQCIVGNKLTAAASAGMAVYWNQSQKKFLWSTANGSNSTEIWCSTAMDSFIYDSWHHIAMVRNSSDAKKGYFYVDGVRYDLASIPAIRDVSSSTTVRVGHTTSAGASYYFTGRINDVRIYDHAISAKEVHDISKALVLHFPLDNNGGGGENLLKNSSFSENTDDWSFSNPATGDGIVTEDGYRCLKITGALTTTRYVRQSVLDKISGDAVGTLYTISADVKIKDVVRGMTNPMCEYYFGGSYNNGGTSTWMGATTISGNPVFWSNPNNQWVRHIWVIRFNHAPTSMTFSVYSRDMTGEIYVRNIKMERGSIATEWSPASEDNVVYDCSGFHNDAILNNITFNTDTPRYDACSEFTSSKYSYVKVTDNKWMAQAAPEFTINFWANPATWSGQSKYFSCTESGGFNTEGGSSGYIRFPNHVYTNAALTSTAYKYNSTELKISDIPAGWHMITFVKTLEGNKVYIDGELHSSYNFVNYGEHFNLNARLFLGCEASTANPSGPYYTGMMSDFRLYYTELSPEDIKELYEVGASVDNLQNMHTYWYIEDPTYSNPSITKAGIVKENELEEADKASLFSSGKVTAKEIIEI